MTAVADTLLVRTLEELCFNAWPTLRTVHLDGWVVRLADGHTRRANSANALYDSRLPPAELIDAIEPLFGRAGLKPVFRITPLVDAAMAQALRVRGYTGGDVSFGMWARTIADVSMDPQCAMEQSASDDWLREAMRAYGYGAQGEAALRRTFANIVLPTAFATLRDARGVAVAWGVAVAERGYVGLYDLVVDEGARANGFGRKLVTSLLAWGRAHGATQAYLQVRAGNAAARGLYGSLGFADAYRYDHFTRA